MINKQLYLMPNNYYKFSIKKLTEKVTFGAVYLSPKHPEMEIIRRINTAAKAVNADFYFIDKEGYCYDSGKNVIKDCDFIFIFDPSHISLFNGFCYHVSWFCPGLVNPSTLLQYNILSYNCDDILSFPSKSISGFTSILSQNIFHTSTNNSYLYPSVPYDYVIKPKNFSSSRDQYKVFYSGINIEGSKKNVDSLRHGGLFSILDKGDCISFFGPNKINGKQNWQGFNNYKGEVSFDGHSIIKKANEFGIYLAIQHDLHNIHGMITNRFFEACAAGCIAIVNRVEFITHNFGDSVFYLDTADKDHESIARQIYDIVEWSNSNKDKAYQMAQRCQKIFLEKFELSSVIYDICRNHKNRVLQLHNAQSKILKDSYIDIILTIYDDKHLIANQIKDILSQDYDFIKVIIIAKINLTQEYNNLIKQLKSKFDVEIKTCLEAKESFQKRKSSLFYANDLIKSDFFIFSSPYQRWHKNHIRNTLIKICDDKDCFMSYSGVFTKQISSEKKGDKKQKITSNLLLHGAINNLKYKLLSFFYIQDPVCYAASTEIQRELLLSSAIFRSKVIKLIPPESLENIYNYEHLCLSIVAIANNKYILPSNKVTTYIEDFDPLKQITMNERIYYRQNIFENKSYGTPYQSIIDCLYSLPEVQKLLSNNRFNSSLLHNHQINDLNKKLNKLNDLNKKLNKLHKKNKLFLYFIVLILTILLYVIFR